MQVYNAGFDALSMLQEMIYIFDWLSDVLVGSVWGIPDENGVVYFDFMSCDQVLHGLEIFEATLHLTPLLQYDLYCLL